MVRYIKHGEQADSSVLCHYNVPGSKWGVRRYQYPDGTYTPLGREHYGIGVKKDRTRYEKIRDKTKAAIETAKGYRIIKKRQKEMSADLRAEKRLKNEAERRESYKTALDREKSKNSLNIDESYAKNQRRLDAEKQDEDRKKEQGERLNKEFEEAKEKMEPAKEWLDKRMEVNPKDKQMEGLRDEKFNKMSNEELQEYTTRLDLERKAKNAELQTKLQKLGAPVDVANKLLSYGKTAVDAYDSYKKIKSILNGNKERVPVFNKPLNEMTNSELQAYKNRMDLLKSASDSVKSLRPKQTSFNKPISEMSNDELHAYKDRMTLEKDVRTLRNEYSHPKEYGQQSISRQTAKSLLEDIGSHLNNGEKINYDSIEKALKETDFGKTMNVLGEIQKLENIEAGRQNNQQQKKNK